MSVAGSYDLSSPWKLQSGRRGACRNGKLVRKGSTLENYACRETDLAEDVTRLYLPVWISGMEGCIVLPSQSWVEEGVVGQQRTEVNVHPPASKRYYIILHSDRRAYHQVKLYPHHFWKNLSHYYSDSNTTYITETMASGAICSS